MDVMQKYAIHKGISELFTGGWDVALTTNGPLVFEGNDGWCSYVSKWNDATVCHPHEYRIFRKSDISKNPFLFKHST